MKRQLHKKIYYIPGILTLAIAPILFTIKTDKFIADRNQYCIPIIRKFDSCCSNKSDLEFFGINPHANTNYIQLEIRKFIKIEINGNNYNDSLKTILIENFSKGLKLSSDTTLGLKVVFNNKVKYKGFINVFNSCIKSEINYFLPFGDTIFICYVKNKFLDNKRFVNIPNTKDNQIWEFDDTILKMDRVPDIILDNIMICGTPMFSNKDSNIVPYNGSTGDLLSSNDYHKNINKPSFIDKISLFFKSNFLLIKLGWPFLILYILLLIGTFYRFKKD